MHIKQQAREAARAVLLGNTAAGANVVEGRDYATDRETLPIIVVTASIERTPELDAGGAQGMTCTLIVELVTDAASTPLALAALDALELEVLAALDDLELILNTGNLAYLGTDAPIAEATSSRPTVQQTMSFAMEYRVERGDHETPV
jgi:hypothetical protein